METAEQLSEIEIKQRLEQLTNRERNIKIHPSHDAKEILEEAAVLEEITQEKRRLAKLLLQRREEAEQQRQEVANHKLAERDQALREAEELRGKLLKNAKAFEDFVETYREYVRLSHKAYTADKGLETRRDDRALHLDSFSKDGSMERTRVALTNAFGAELFGLPPFAQARNAGYGIREAVERASFKRG